MEKICIIYTGGTIGSAKSDKGINVNDKQKEILIERFYENYEGEEVEFDEVSPITTLSENMTCEKWVSIVDCISEQLEKGYKGIVLTHGTDTLAYTACMVAFMFADCNIPIVLVSSNQPLGNPNANGHYNFMSAVQFIMTSGLRGVYVAYRDRYLNNNILLATRCTQAMQITGEVLSANGEPFGKMVDGYFRYNPKNNPTLQEVNNKKIISPGKSNKFCNEFILIKPYVGMNYEFFHSKYRAKFILHELYHSGTACVEGGNNSLIEFSSYCKQNKIDLYLSPMDKNQNMYSSSVELQENKVKIIKGMSIEATLVKLMIAYGSYSSSKIRETFLNQDLFFEYM